MTPSKKTSAVETRHKAQDGAEETRATEAAGETPEAIKGVTLTEPVHALAPTAVKNVSQAEKAGFSEVHGIPDGKRDEVNANSEVRDADSEMLANRKGETSITDDRGNAVPVRLQEANKPTDDSAK